MTEAERQVLREEISRRRKLALRGFNEIDDDYGIETPEDRLFAAVIALSERDAIREREREMLAEAQRFFVAVAYVAEQEQERKRERERVNERARFARAYAIRDADPDWPKCAAPGCDKPTAVAVKSDKSRGRVIGQPRQFCSPACSLRMPRDEHGRIPAAA
jgi:hypothetical protein